MNTTQLARRVARENGWSYEVANTVVPAVIQTLRNSLAEGQPIKLRGVGRFDFIKKGGYKINTAWTEEKSMMMPVNYYIRFTPIEELKAEVKSLDHSVFENQDDSNDDEEE